FSSNGTGSKTQVLTGKTHLAPKHHKKVLELLKQIQIALEDKSSCQSRKIIYKRRKEVENILKKISNWIWDCLTLRWLHYLHLFIL
uniref:Uncharacterized protein n=1 Tax=Sciurus vulgaris TaxID=55149 RepID=A0A8D2DA38_SCIVU